VDRGSGGGGEQEHKGDGYSGFHDGVLSGGAATAPPF
jgi:hypothetical protein